MLNDLAGDVVHGIDPAAAKTQKRNDQTVGELLDRYIRDHVRVMLKPSTRWSSERLIKGKIRPPFGKTKLKELTRADISSWHRSMSNTPVEANRALACLRKSLSLASGDWELLEQNPARGISPFPEQKRERVPTDEELRKLGAWLAQVEADGSELPGCVLAAKLMFFTAMRRGEVLGLEWSFIDLENGSARLPDAKSGRRTVPLGITTVELLKNVSRTGKFVCCGFKANEMLSEATFRGFWDRMRTSTGIKGLSAHDLRRGLSHERLSWVSARLQSGILPDIEAWRWRTGMSNELGTRFVPLRMKFRNEWLRHFIQSKGRESAQNEFRKYSFTSAPVLRHMLYLSYW